MLKDYFIKIEEREVMKIPHIRCLRDASRVVDEYENTLHVMGLMDAKAAIELAYEGTRSLVRLTEEGAVDLTKQGFDVWNCDNRRVYPKGASFRYVFKKDLSQFIKAIKEYRQATGEGLKEAKDVIDEMRDYKRKVKVNITDQEAKILKNYGWEVTESSFFKDTLFEMD